MTDARSTMTSMDEFKPMLARATIHLPGGLQPGGVYWVDPRSEYVQECFERHYLVPEPMEESDE